MELSLLTMKTFQPRIILIGFFCHPYCSGERGLNENTNGLIRDFYPKRTDFRLVPDEDIKEVQNILNTRPRERIGIH